MPCSHISREMNKPCIVGTVHATQIFHDGDQVQLDLRSGVVRRVTLFGEVVRSIEKNT